MPKPVYIVYARGICEDRVTNAITIFNVHEKVAIRRLPEPEGDEVAKAETRGKRRGVLEATQTRVLAIWMKEPGDEAVEFEHEFAFRCEGEVEVVPSRTPFAFEDKWQRRFNLTMKGFPEFETSGIVEIESRIRKVGDEDWIVQSYPVLFEVIEKVQEPEEAPASGNGSRGEE